MNKSAKHTVIAALLLTLAATASIVISLPHVTSSLQENAEKPKTPSPLWPEAFTGDQLCVRNLGTRDIEVDALYYREYGSRETLYQQRVNPPVPIPPGEVKCINIPPLPDSIKSVGPIELVLAGRTGPLTSYPIDANRGLVLLPPPAPPGGGGSGGAPPSPPTSSPLLSVYLVTNTSRLEGSPGETLLDWDVEWITVGDGHGTVLMGLLYDTGGNLPQPYKYTSLIGTYDTAGSGLKFLNVTVPLNTLSGLAPADFVEACQGPNERYLYWIHEYTNTNPSPHDDFAFMYEWFDAVGGSLPLVGVGAQMEWIYFTFRANILGKNDHFNLRLYKDCVYDASGNAYLIHGLGYQHIVNTILLEQPLDYILQFAGTIISSSLITLRYTSGAQSYTFTDEGKPSHIIATNNYILLSASFLHQVQATTPPTLVYTHSIYLRSKTGSGLGGISHHLADFLNSSRLPPVLGLMGGDILLAGSSGGGSKLYLSRVSETTLANAVQNSGGLPALVLENPTLCTGAGGCEVIDLLALDAQNATLLASLGGWVYQAGEETPSTNSLLLATVDTINGQVVNALEMSLTINGSLVWLSDVELAGVDGGMLWLTGYYGFSPYGLGGVFALGLNMSVVTGGEPASSVVLDLSGTTVGVYLNTVTLSSSPGTLLLQNADTVLQNVVVNDNYIVSNSGVVTLDSPILPPGLIVLLYSQ